MSRGGAFVVSAMLVALAGCSEPAGPSLTCSGVALEAASLVLESNGQASGLGRIDEEGCLTEIPDIALGVDPTFSLGRGGPMVSVRDAGQGVVHQIDPGSLAITRTLVPYEDAELTEKIALPCGQAQGINPHDADMDASGRLWATRWEKPTLGIVEADGSFGGRVDLSSFADADGLPEPEALRVVDGRVYVALERLDRCDGYKPAGPGLIVAIDAESRKIEGSFELGGANPFGRMVAAPWDVSGGTVAIALPGLISAIEDGDAAAIVDLKGLSAKGFGRENELDGSVMEVVLAAPDEAYVIVAGTSTENPTRVVRINPETGVIGATLLDSRDSRDGGGYCYTGLAVVGERLLVGENHRCSPAVHVLDRSTGTEVGVIRPSRLPPISLLSTP